MWTEARDVAKNDSTDFIQRNKKLKYFELIFVQLGDSHCNIDGERITRVSEDLPQLESAVTHTSSSSANGMLQFLFECKLLKQWE